MSEFRTQLRTILGKVETTAGIDAAPTVGANAVRCESPLSNPNPQTAEVNEATDGLDQGARVPAGGDRGFTCKVNLRGSGTAGTAPEVDPLLKGCALGITTLAADVTGTAAAAGAATITLAAGASSVDNAYRGMVIEITAGTGVGQKRIVAAYVGGTKVATVTPSWTTVPTGGTYAVRACNVYAPLSVGVPNVTVYDYAHSVSGGQSKLKKLVGGAGNARFSLAPKSIPSWDFEFRGLMALDTDVTYPGAATYQPDVKVAYMGAQVYLGNVQVGLNNLSFDLGNQPTSEDDPNQVYGSGIAGITRRRLSGSMRLPTLPEATLSALGSWTSGTQFTLSSIHGPSPGARFAVLFQNVVYTGQSVQDVNGFLYQELPFDIAAANAGFWFCYF